MTPPQDTAADDSAKKSKLSRLQDLTTSQIVWLAASGVLFVGGFGIGVAIATGADWSAAAGWVEAVATAGALGAAITAALFVARTLHLELEREERRLTADEQAQAVLVAVWATGAARPGKFALGGPMSGTETVSGVKAVAVAYLNASITPIYDVVIEVEAKMRDPLVGVEGFEGDAQWQTTRGVLELPYIRPKEDTEVMVELTPGLRWPRPGVSSDLAAHGFAVTASITFRDSGNKRWKRSPFGLGPAE